MASTKKNSAMKLSKIESCDDDYEHCNLIRSNSTRKLRAILFHFFFKDCQTMSPVLCLIDSAYQQTQANEKKSKILKKFHFVYRSVFFFRRRIDKRKIFLLRTKLHEIYFQSKLLLRLDLSECGEQTKANMK